MYHLSYSFHFDAAHRLNCVDEHSPCRRLHGHRWEVVLVISSEVLYNSMVIDFNHLKVITNGIAEKWDHQFINECPELRGEEPTAEHLAIILYGMIQDELNRVEAGPGQSLRLVAVTVEEAPGHKVTYSP